MKRVFLPSLLLVGFVWIAGGVERGWAADSPSGPAPSGGFLGRTRDAAVAVAEHDASGAAATGVEQLNEAFKIALEKGLTDAKYKELLGRAGKYAKVVDLALKAIKMGNLSNECRVALVNGNRDEFAKAFNNLVREGVKMGAGTAGAAKGAKVGALGIKGGLLVLITVPAGAIIGGLAAEKLAEKAYDELLAGSITELGELIFDTVKGPPPGSASEGEGEPGPPGVGLPHPDDGSETEGQRPEKLRRFR